MYYTVRVRVILSLHERDLNCARECARARYDKMRFDNHLQMERSCKTIHL